MFAKFAKFCEEKGQGDLKKVWNEVFRDVKLDDNLKYPWPEAKAEELESEHQADDPENAGEPRTDNSGVMNDEQ